MNTVLHFSKRINYSVRSSINSKRCNLLIICIFISVLSFAQVKLTVSGTKLSMASSVVLSAKDLSVTNSGAVNVAASTIKIAGSISSSNAIDVTNGDVEMNGSGNQQIPAAVFSGNVIKDLIINTNNSSIVTIGGPLGLTDVLTVSNGILASRGNLTLKSVSAKTARVAPVTSLAATPIRENVTVERFILAKRAFRFLTAPVNTPGNIRANWMESANNTTTAIQNNPVPGYGTDITGAGGNVNGFDATATGNPSLYTYDNLNQAYVTATNTFTNLAIGRAYLILIRGDRSINLSTNNPPPSVTTLRSFGTLITGPVVMAKPGGGGTAGMPVLSTAGEGYSFIGNPYASPVDWLQIDKTGVTGSIYIFDPLINGTNGRGAYVSYNGSTGVSNIASLIDNNIQSGQAFFIQTNGSNPSVTFQENYKTPNNRQVFRTLNVMPNMSVQLLLPGQELTGQAADGFQEFFSDDFNDTIGAEDSYKFTNQDENIAIARDGKLLSIEGRKTITANDTIPIKMWQVLKKNYIFKTISAHFDPSITAYLEDSFLHTYTRLNNDSVTLVPFAVTSNTASAIPDRFRIVFKPAFTLPIQLLTVTAFEKDKGIEVNWIAESENNMQKYEVEKSPDANHFATAATVKANANPGVSSSYNWFDESPLGGDNFYRIKSVDKSAVVKYSKIVKVTIQNTEGTISLVSNPINGNTITLLFKNILKGDYTLSLLNDAGQKIYGGSISHAGGSANHKIIINQTLSNGMYQLQLKGINKSVLLSVFVQKYK